ncbi:MAG: histidine phosphatase family protein, partial [Deltaproteobacteria bacterium]|nr:histidine phosphatase family protein [Deltaproteobacteria bacterium]
MAEPSWRRIKAHGGVAVLLIRHAQTEFNASRRFCGGRSDPPL